MIPWTLSTSQQPQQQIASSPDCSQPHFKDMVMYHNFFSNGMSVKYLAIFATSLTIIMNFQYPIL